MKEKTKYTKKFTIYFISIGIIPFLTLPLFFPVLSGNILGAGINGGVSAAIGIFIARWFFKKKGWKIYRVVDQK